MRPRVMPSRSSVDEVGAFREGRDLETLDDAPVLLRPLHDRITDAGRVDQPSAMVVPAVILVEGVSPWGGAGE
jgi:hypothetical protein